MLISHLRLLFVIVLISLQFSVGLHVVRALIPPNGKRPKSPRAGDMFKGRKTQVSFDAEFDIFRAASVFVIHFLEAEIAGNYWALIMQNGCMFSKRRD